MGVNTAILDVCDLASGIISGIETGSDLNWVLKLYESTMIPRGEPKSLNQEQPGNQMMPSRSQVAAYSATTLLQTSHEIAAF